LGIPADPQSSSTGISDAIDMPLAALIEREIRHLSAVISRMNEKTGSALVKLELELLASQNGVLISCATHKK
jgi:hypothetical protein